MSKLLREPPQETSVKDCAGGLRARVRLRPACRFHLRALLTQESLAQGLLSRRREHSREKAGRFLDSRISSRQQDFPPSARRQCRHIQAGNITSVRRGWAPLLLFLEPGVSETGPFLLASQASRRIKCAWEAIAPEAASPSGQHHPPARIPLRPGSPSGQDPPKPGTIFPPWYCGTKTYSRRTCFPR